jgi:hypothetical protein
LGGAGSSEEGVVLEEREREREARVKGMGHKEWLRERGGSAVCQRWGRAFDVLFVRNEGTRNALESGAARVTRFERRGDASEKC